MADRFGAPMIVLAAVAFPDLISRYRSLYTSDAALVSGRVWADLLIILVARGTAN